MLLEKVFKTIDYFGLDVGLKIEGNNKFKTVQGGIISFLIIVFCLIFGFYFGKEIYERKIPIVSKSDEFNLNSQVLLKDFPIFFNIADTLGESVDFLKYFDIKVFKMNFTSSGKVDWGGIIKDYKPIPCSIRHFKKAKNYLHPKEYNALISHSDLICFDFYDDELIQNPFASLNSTYIEFTISMCNPLKKDCPDIDNPIYSEAYSNIYYINSFIDFSNYNKPINYYLDNYVQLFSKDYLKRIYINLSKNIISIDNGWIFSLEKEFNFVSVSSIKTDISSISKTSPLDVLWIDFNSPNIFHKYRRRYLTIQNLFAQLGGIANSLFVFSQILISIFVKFKYYSFLDFEIKKMTKSNKLISKEKLELNLINNISSIIKNKIFENEDLSKVNINSKNIINQYIEIFDKKDPIEENEDNSKLKNDINKDINKNPLSLRSNNCALNNEINLPIKKIKTKIDLKRNDSSKIIKDEKQIEKSFFEYLLSFFNNKYREKFKVDFEFIEKTLDIINFINNFQLSNSSAI